MFEVLQFIVELLYSSYIYEIKEMKRSHPPNTAQTQVSFVEEFKYQKLSERHDEQGAITEITKRISR